MPVCIPEKYCKVPAISENLIPIYNNLYLDEYAVLHDEIKYKCLQEGDVNIGGSTQICVLTQTNQTTWSGLKPRCVHKNFSLTSNNGIIYLSISICIISLFILAIATYCAFRLNETATKAVQVFNEHQQLVQQQNVSVPSGSTSSSHPEGSYASNQSLINVDQRNAINSRQLPKIPSLYQENIYDSVQNTISEPRYVDFRAQQLPPNNKQQPSTWDTLKRKLNKQDEIDDLTSTSYRRMNTDSCEYDYVDLKANESIYKRIIDMSGGLPTIPDTPNNLTRQSTFKRNDTTSDTQF